MHFVAAYSFARDLVLMATQTGYRPEGIFLAAEILLLCVFASYVVRIVTVRAKPSQVEPWLIDHLQSQTRTFWVVTVLLLPIFILVGVSLLLALFALLFRSFRGWIALFHRRSVHSGEDTMPNPSVNTDAAR